MGFNLDPNYIDVPSRIAEFRTKHPEGSLQQKAMDFREVNGGWWVIYCAAAYRTPDDERPGIGTAWEPIPGRTPYTKDSEVQNAETAAWGRAIVAALAADTKRGIASAEEVRNRHAEREQAGEPPDPLTKARQEVADVWKAKHGDLDKQAVEDAFAQWSEGEILTDATPARLHEFAVSVAAEDEKPAEPEQPALPADGEEAGEK